MERAVELGLDGLAVTDHQGLYGAVRFASAAQEAGLRPIVGLEVELLDPAVPDPDGVVVPHRRRRRRGSTGPVVEAGLLSGMASTAGMASVAGVSRGADVVSAAEGRPVRPQRRAIASAWPPGAAARGPPARCAIASVGPHLVLLARDLTGYRSLCRLVSAAHLAGTKGVPRFTHALLAEHAEGLVALSRMPPR